jgi:hypothetical protein
MSVGSPSAHTPAAGGHSGTLRSGIDVSWLLQETERGGGTGVPQQLTAEPTVHVLSKLNLKPCRVHGWPTAPF